jgi:hypothetical protein
MAKIWVSRVARWVGSMEVRVRKKLVMKKNGQRSAAKKD